MSKRNIWALAVWLGVSIATPAAVSAQSVPVVPGGFGFGMQTRAAYGCGTSPTIYRVTSLGDSGPGTMRAALEASGPRVVIFEISGYVDLSSVININNPCITVAGQTAPTPGITVRYRGIQVRTHDVLLQHFRIRPGWTGSNCNDTLGLYDASGAPYNIVFDHMSISWGQDENVYVMARSRPADFTFWRSITSEKLNRIPGSALCTGKEEDSHGFLVYDMATNVSVIQSLFAHNVQRNPYMQNGTGVVLLNNIIYDWYKEWGFFFGNHANLSGGAWHATAVGNRFVRGPNTVNPGDGNVAYMFFYRDNEGVNQAGNQIYRSDNTLANDPDGKVVDQYWDTYNPNVTSPPSPMPTGYSAMPSSAVESFVLATVGARPADRDRVDTRLVAEVSSRTGIFVVTQNDVGGWPPLTSTTRSLSLPSSPHTVRSSGYTALEEWLHDYATGVESGSTPNNLTAPTNLRIVP